MKVKGITVSTPMLRPDWNQDNPLKADYIKNKPDLEKLKGIYLGPGEMPDGYNVQIDPNGDALNLDEVYAHIEDTQNPHNVTVGQVEGAISQDDMETYLEGNYVTQWDFEEAIAGVFTDWYKVSESNSYYRTNLAYAEELVTHTASINPQETSEQVTVPFTNYMGRDGFYYSITVEGPDNPYVTGSVVDYDMDDSVRGLTVYIAADAPTTVTLKVHALGRLW